MSIKHVLSSLISIAILGMPAITMAAPMSGDLIKASAPSVYYFGANQKRYVFPTEKTYLSWYSDFSTVRTISDAELASYSLGGNVTYRPGTRLVKVTTDPKVYAIARNGTLRWVQTEEIARTLFGASWAQQVDDIPDAFFINYRIGAAVTNTQDFVPVQEQQRSATINQDKELAISSSPTPPPSTTPATSTTPLPPSNPTSTAPMPYTATHVLSKTSAQPGDLVGVQVNATPSAGLDTIRILFNGVAQKVCTFNPCGGELLIPTSNVQSSYDVHIDVTWITGQRFTATSTLQVGTNGASAITVTIPRPEIKPGTTREAVVIVDNSLFARYIDIFLDGNNVRGCVDTQECRYSSMETSATGTVHTVYATVSDRNGITRRSATSTFRVVDNDRPVVQVAVGKTSLRVGETVDVTVSGTDDDGIQSTEIWMDGTMLKQCRAVSCTMVVGPWNQPRMVSFVGRAVDTQGLDNQSSSTTINVE